MTYYDFCGNPIENAYDFAGNPLEPDHLPWNFYAPNAKRFIDTVMADIDADDYDVVIPVLSDSHQYHSGNEPNYFAYNYLELCPTMLMLGDFCNNTSIFSENEFATAVGYIGGGNDLKKIVAVGNHELGNWSENDKVPSYWLRPLLPADAVAMDGDALCYYYDDTAIRYIVMDSCTPTYKSSGTQLLPVSQIDFVAKALMSTDRDVIICNHAIGHSFYAPDDVDKATRIADTTVTNMITKFDGIVNAFKSRSQFSFTADGTTYSYNFGGKEQDMIALITGHYHACGHIDEQGYNAFTVPCISNASAKWQRGMSVFCVKKSNRAIRWYAIDYYADAPMVYDYIY